MTAFIVALICMFVLSTCYLVLEIGSVVDLHRRALAPRLSHSRHATRNTRRAHSAGTTWSLCLWYRELQYATSDLGGIDGGARSDLASCPAFACLNLKAISFIVKNDCVCDPATIDEVHALSKSGS